jgi:hypothetical protein
VRMKCCVNKQIKSRSINYSVVTYVKNHKITIFLVRVLFAIVIKIIRRDNKNQTVCEVGHTHISVTL